MGHHHKANNKTSTTQSEGSLAGRDSYPARPTSDLQRTAMATAAAVDPLGLLRATLASGKEIRRLPSDSPDAKLVYTFQECTHIAFPSPSSSTEPAAKPIILAKTTPTRFKRTPQSTNDQVYDLQSLLLCYVRRHASIAEYAADAVKEGCELVGIMQRKLVSDYLEGKDLGAAVEGYLVPEETVTDETDEPSAAGAIVDTSVEGSISTSKPSGAVTTRSAGDTSTTSGQPPAKKTKYIVNKEDLEAYKKIVSRFEARQISDRNSVLRNPAVLGKKSVNFASVRDMIADRLKAGKEELRRGPGNQPSSQVQQASAPSQQQKRRRQLNPIIIISPSSSALITMYNVKKFLEEAIYVPSDTARAQSNRVAEDVVQIMHKRQIGTTASDGRGGDAYGGGLSGSNRAERGAAGEKLVRYFVVDGVDALSKFGDDAWDRVVCVMTTGQEWQFRPYKWTKPKELFHHVKGIYVKWTNDPPNPKIATWNVSELKIDPMKRHLDKSTVSDFWRNLEYWTAQHKSGAVDF